MEGRTIEKHGSCAMVAGPILIQHRINACCDHTLQWRGLREPRGQHWITCLIVGTYAGNDADCPANPIGKTGA